MLASLPDSEPIMPRRSLMSRAYQFVCEPQSPHRITSCGSFGDSPQHTSCGLIGSADAIERASESSHQVATRYSMLSRPLRSSLDRKNAVEGKSVTLLIDLG